MRLLITGVGDAFTCRHFGTSAVIDAPQGFVLIDCPDPVHRVVREAADAAGWPLAAQDIDDIVLTHLHGDHSNGLESFGFLRWVRREASPHVPRPRLHLTRPALDRLWQKLAPAMDGAGRPTPIRTLEDFYEPHVITPERDANVAGLTVRCRFTRHPIPTIGLLISDGNATLGWSGDTPFERAHIDWLAEADLVVHESNRGPAHTPIEDLNALPDPLRAKIRLIHLPDDFDPSCTDLRPLGEGEVLKI